MPIISLNDWNVEPLVKQDRKAGIVGPNDFKCGEPGNGYVRARRVKRKRTNQDKDEDRDGDEDYCDKHDEDTDEDRDEVEVSKGKRQKQRSSEGSEVNGIGYKTLTPRQMTALHWANLDVKIAATKREQAAVATGHNKGVTANQVAGVNDQGAGDANGAGPVTGKLRNGKKRYIWQRLGGN